MWRKRTGNGCANEKLICFVMRKVFSGEILEKWEWIVLELFLGYTSEMVDGMRLMDFFWEFGFLFLEVTSIL